MLVFPFNFPEFQVTLDNLVLWLRLVLRVWSESKSVVCTQDNKTESWQNRKEIFLVKYDYFLDIDIDQIKPHLCKAWQEPSS